MPKEIQNLPERPIDQLRRHDVTIKLQEEQWEDQQEINEQNRLWKAKYEEELRLLRDAYRNDRSMVIIFWQVIRFLGKSSFYVGAAAIGWAWNHPNFLGNFWDKIEEVFRSNKS